MKQDSIGEEDVRRSGFWYRKLGPTGGAIALSILEILQVLIISAAIILPVRYFLIQPFYVKGASMEPNFYDNEYLIIDEISFRFREPVRGEVIVFRYPRDRSEYFIKRVIGLPGETVEVTQDHVVIYNEQSPSGVVLDEPYLGGNQTNGQKKVTLQEDEYYVLGDNRQESLDSRSFGPLPEDDLIGRVWLRGLPLSRATIFSVPYY